nr:MAG TPA: hypothetical protein [Caudoviricetes sp.]
MFKIVKRYYKYLGSSYKTSFWKDRIYDEKSFNRNAKGSICY